jgi:very-short-patch-repair endonuclease
VSKQKMGSSSSAQQDIASGTEPTGWLAAISHREIHSKYMTTLPKPGVGVSGARGGAVRWVRTILNRAGAEKFLTDPTVSAPVFCKHAQVNRSLWSASVQHWSTDPELAERIARARFVRQSVRASAIVRPGMAPARLHALTEAITDPSAQRMSDWELSRKLRTTMDRVRSIREAAKITPDLRRLPRKLANIAGPTLAVMELLAPGVEAALDIEAFHDDRMAFYRKAYLAYLALMEVAHNIQEHVADAYYGDVEEGRAPMSMVAFNRNMAEARLAAALIASGDTAHIRQWKVPGSLRAVDFAWPEDKLFVEVDGSIHHNYPAAIQGDTAKNAWAAEHGWTVMRVDSVQTLKDPTTAVQRIREARDLLIERRRRSSCE